MYKLIIISIVILFGCLFAFQQIDPNISISNTQTQVTEQSNKISITIEGEIKIPGIYKMEITSTLFDLVEKAGGLTELADTNAINLTLSLDNRNYFYIPKISQEVECVPQPAFVKINVNSATVEELATINYVSLTLAEKIVNYRNENGPFLALEDLMNVSGIGQATYEKIRDYITLS